MKNIDMENEILNGVLAEFENLAAIPRMTGHEKAVSDFLRDYMEKMGLRVIQDEKYNLIADLPASEGMEQAPLTILQGHMDMVCVAEEGRSYDPLKDPIRLLRDEKYLRADGTSLGSDDGIGIAEILYIMKNLKKHGPIRAIFTVDEEQGMSGAEYLDAKYLQDAKFLINCDSENYDELTIGCAGNVSIYFERTLSWKAPGHGKAYQVEIRGLCGGHSGERIGDGRGNAIRILAQALREIQKTSKTELALITGGKAMNAIPDSARAVIATDLSADEMEKCLARCRERLQAIYGNIEKNAVLEAKACPIPVRVMAYEDSQRLLQLVTLLHTGIYANSQEVPGLIETSANLGIIHTEGDKTELRLLPRSAVDQKLEEFCQMAEDLAELTGFELRHSRINPGWKERVNSPLTALLCEIFERQNGKPMKVGAIHAGVECGWHFKKNPALDIVSIGVTTLDIHSPRERLLLETVAPQVKLIEESLRKIAEM